MAPLPRNVEPGSQMKLEIVTRRIAEKKHRSNHGRRRNRHEQQRQPRRVCGCVRCRLRRGLGNYARVNGFRPIENYRIQQLGATANRQRIPNRALLAPLARIACAIRIPPKRPCVSEYAGKPRACQYAAAAGRVLRDCAPPLNSAARFPGTKPGIISLPSSADKG